jgi:hypothetical protein
LNVQVRYKMKSSGRISPSKSKRNDPGKLPKGRMYEGGSDVTKGFNQVRRGPKKMRMT